MKYKSIIALFALCLAACGGSITDTEVYYADAVWTDFEGKWVFIGEYGTDGYTIENSQMSYDDGGDFEEYDSDFTADIIHCYKFIIFNAETATDSINTSVKDGSGVFIIRLSSGANAGKYTAVYFRHFSTNPPKKADMSTAYYDGQFPYCFDTPEAAAAGFASLSAVNKYVLQWGGPYEYAVPDPALLRLP